MRKEVILESRLDQIAEETYSSWYQDMPHYQREELSREELFQYAEEMREALNRIFDLTCVISIG